MLHHFQAARKNTWRKNSGERARDGQCMGLSQANKHFLASKAAQLLPLELDELQTRLQHVANTQSDSLEFKSLQQRSDSIASIPPLIPVQDLEKSSRQELIRDGGRPACSIQELSHILAAPMARYQAVRSWLSDEPDTETGEGEIKTVFSRQFMRWWDFRKSQWDSRGLDNSEEGLSAFLEASRRKYEGMDLKAMTCDPSFDETIQRQWQRMPESQELPKGQTFSTYSHAVKTRLAPHHFARPLQLKRYPQKQTAWTNWLEYLSFELRCQETLIRAAESLDMEFHQARKRLLRAKQPDGNKAARSSAASDSTQTRQPFLGGKGATKAKELAAARADRDASQKSIGDFIQETEAYTQAHRAALYQRHRVDWVIEEARLMETEMSQHCSTAKTKKRKQRDEEEPSEPQPKRTTRRDGSANANADAVPGMSHRRRSTRLSARRTGVKDCAPLPGIMYLGSSTRKHT